ncbi:hypothetical protein K458DRAFT_438621 [Lentithecium fluviatile CBS 122367]|uniref:DUF7924 domain-containing protein n=1 Tax=Lentithecium fluviatile CBS 122367 TaxID=1168545 RepID=A0A6G1JL27_9PLEO|nr:hypothetical protein K458DRAFT_438621 [Lentithecium fluviatile CBS 122367]
MAPQPNSAPAKNLALPAAQNRRRVSVKKNECRISKAAPPRRSSRIASHVQQLSQQSRRSPHLQRTCPTQATSDSVKQAKTRKRSRTDEASSALRSLEPSVKRVRTSLNEPNGQQTASRFSIEHWSTSGHWPTDEQEATMNRHQELAFDARARRRSLSRKRSNGSLASDMVPAPSTSSMSRDQKCAPYKHPLFERQLKECGSFMDDHELGITAESEKLCRDLLKEPQPVPQHTLFSDDKLFRKTCKRVKGENETKVVRDIAPFIVPSAEILADQGAEHLTVLRETTNACWVNSEPFLQFPSSSAAAASSRGPRPQPDYGLGFERDAFSTERLQKLQPYLGDLLKDSSVIAATYQMYLPFLTSEVKCGDGGLDVADRQNANSQSIILRGLYSLFRLVNREKELDREINGFSISHNDEETARFYRHLISKFIFAPSGEGDSRWKAYKFVKNVYDLWLPNQFKRICSVIDSLPVDPGSNVSVQDVGSSSSGLSQPLEDYSFNDGQTAPNSLSSVQPATPGTTVDIESSNSNKRSKR